MIEQLELSLRSLGPRKFEQFCFDLLKAKYPGREIRRVEGSAGDEGIDVFSGELECGPTIWQCKSFSNAIGPSQKDRNSSGPAKVVSQKSLRILGLGLDIG
jgi:hypothetical protein